MWQRIQTLWWLLAIVAMGLFAGNEVLLFTLGGELVPKLALTSCGIEERISGEVWQSNWLLAILSGLSIVLSVVSIFIYKMRTFQMRLSILNIFVLLGTLGAVVYLAYKTVGVEESISVSITVWLSMPLVAIILQALAARSVLADEMLVRMSNRLR